MDYWVETGNTAGKVYREIEMAGGSITLSALKKKVKEKNVDYAIGWLLREDKITIVKKGNSVRLQML